MRAAALFLVAVSLLALPARAETGARLSGATRAAAATGGARTPQMVEGGC